MENNGLVTITQEEYDKLSQDNLFLSILKSTGVDSWDGWEAACEEYSAITEEGEY